ANFVVRQAGERGIVELSEAENEVVTPSGEISGVLQEALQDLYLSPQERGAISGMDPYYDPFGGESFTDKVLNHLRTNQPIFARAVRVQDLLKKETCSFSGAGFFKKCVSAADKEGLRNELGRLKEILISVSRDDSDPKVRTKANALLTALDESPKITAAKK
ncbi:MAG: hypothetical protein U1D33_03595, partial [bacterium]|nr:hypothetical protein [bacterium]